MTVYHGSLSLLLLRGSWGFGLPAIHLNDSHTHAASHRWEHCMLLLMWVRAWMSGIQHVLGRWGSMCTFLRYCKWEESKKQKCSSLRTALFLWKLGISMATVPIGMQRGREGGKTNTERDITVKLRACCFLATLERPFPTISQFPQLTSLFTSLALTVPLIKWLLYSRPVFQSPLLLPCWQRFFGKVYFQL